MVAHPLRTIYRDPRTEPYPNIFPHSNTGANEEYEQVHDFEGHVTFARTFSLYRPQAGQTGDSY